MPAVRELETNPVTGCITIRSVIDQASSSSGRDDAFNDTPLHFIEENKGSALPDEPDSDLPDPDGNFEEKLEKEGAFIIESKTYYPASKRTIVKRSQTPAEIAEERGYHDFHEALY